MKKIVWTTSVAGFGLSAGGLGMMALNGFDVLNPDLWTLAASIAVQEPMALISAAISGQDKILFRGVLFVVSGVGLAALGLVSTSAIAIVSACIASLRGVTSGRVKKQKKSPRVKQKKLIKFGLGFDASRVISSVKSHFEKDEEIDLEPRFEAAVVNSKASRTSPDRVRLQRSMRDEVVDIIRGVRQRFSLMSGETQSEQGLGRQGFPEHQEATKRGSFGDLSRWYEDAQSGSVDHAVLVSRARDICREWRDPDFNEFASMDPINGAFVVRLVKSWAEREESDADYDDEGSDENLGRRDRDREAMREAMRALKKGQFVSDSDEPEVDLDDEFDDFPLPNSNDSSDDDDAVNLEDVDPKFVAMMEGVKDRFVGEDVDEDDSEVDSKYSEMMSEVSKKFSEEDPKEGAVESVEAEADLGSDEASGGDDLGLGSVIAVIKEMRSFTFMCRSVVEGVDEWPEDLADSEQREEVAIALSSELSVLVDIHLDEDLQILIENYSDDYEEFEWLSENPDVLDAGFVKFIEDITNPSLPETDGDDSDENVEDEEQETRVDDAEDLLGAPDEGGVKTEASDATSDEEPGELSVEDQDVKAEMVLEPTVLESNPEIQIEPVHVPRDVGIPPSEEIDEAENIPLIWGKNCKQAGATEATLAKFIFGKSESSFKSLGLVHVVTVWKRSDGDVRLNVILKKVPEGKWSVKSGGDLRAVNDVGDYVSLPESFLEHNEIKDNKTVVHFYGEGLEPFDDVIVGDGIVATSRIFDVEEIKDFIKK